MINRIHYVASYTNGSFEFYIYLEKSKDIYLYEDDPFERWGTPQPTISYDRYDCDSVFTVKKEVTDLIDAALWMFSPNYFSYGAHDKSLLGIYGKFAGCIIKKHNYHVTQQGKQFIFCKGDKKLISLIHIIRLKSKQPYRHLQ